MSFFSRHSKAVHIVTAMADAELNIAQQCSTSCAHDTRKPLRVSRDTRPLANNHAPITVSATAQNICSGERASGETSHARYRAVRHRRYV